MYVGVTCVGPDGCHKNLKMETKIQTESKFMFPGQQANEKICLVFRQHWITLFSKLLTWLILVAAFFALSYFDNQYLPGLVDEAYLPIVDVVKVVFVMALVLGLFVVLVLYYLNMYVVTSERIVDIKQSSLLHHTISELHLEQIQDVTADVKGFLENIFDYGDVYIQTAAETERFKFDKVPNPTKVTKLILDLYEQLPEAKKIARLK